MAAQKSPLSGYNHNLKYKNRVYHVQTEDSGRDNPHIFTHLFHDGTILSTLRSDYSEIVDADYWEDQLRARMQNQHKDMMKGLIKGLFDDKIVDFFGVLEAEEAEDLPMATLPPPPKRDRARRAADPTPAPESRAARASSGAPWQPPAPTAGQDQQAAAPPERRQQAQRAAQASGVVVAMPMVIVGEQQPPAAPTGPPAETQRRSSGQQPARPPARGQTAGRQPAQGQAPPPEPVFTANPKDAKNVPDSIFGSELISEKSLDEVILAYLSEDMTEE